MSALSRPLPDSQDRPADASFMVPDVPSYLPFHRKSFVAGMSEAIDEAVQNLRDIRSGTDVKAKQIVVVLNGIAERRRKIAYKAGDPEWRLFGKSLEKVRGPRDLIPDDEYHRHYSYFERARRACDEGSKIVITTSAGHIRGSEVKEDGEGGYIVQHPATAECRKLASIAFQQYAELFGKPTPSERDVVHAIAGGTYLLMHGTPYVRGSPACVQALNDAVARVVIGKTFPSFSTGIEPFWEAIFTPQGGFVSSYRGFFL